MGLRSLLALAPADLPRSAEITLDLRVLLVALAGTVFTGFAVALVPALRLSRVPPKHALKAGFGGGSSRTFARRLLVTVQIAACTVLLIGTGLLVRSLQQLLRSEPGFVNDGVLTAQTLLPGSNVVGGAGRHGVNPLFATR